MSKEALTKTQESGQVTFFSRTKNRLWTKGEESGNFLNVVSITPDCDIDTLLIKVHPVGPVCHTVPILVGAKRTIRILLFKISSGFYCRSFQRNAGRIIYHFAFQKRSEPYGSKVGEEAVETVIEAVNGTEEGFLYEASDLVYHLIVLLTSKGYSLDDLARELKRDTNNCSH